MSIQSEMIAKQTAAQQQYAELARQQNSANVGYGYATTAEPECTAPPCFLSDVHRRLESISGLLNNAAGDLTTLNDRLFGAIPRGGSNNAANKASGQASELLERLEGLIERAVYVSEEAARLNSRI